MDGSPQQRPERKSKVDRFLETAAAIAELATLVVLARGPLRRLDKLAIALKSAHVLDVLKRADVLGSVGIEAEFEEVRRRVQEAHIGSLLELVPDEIEKEAV